MENRFHILADREEMRLDVFLSEQLKLTRTKVKYMIDGGHIRVAGVVPKPSLRVKRLMEIEGEIPEDPPLAVIPQAIPLQILYEDEYFLAVNKPAGMVVHPSYGHREGTLVNAILSYLKEPPSDLPSGHAQERKQPGTSPDADPGVPFGERLLLGPRAGIVHRLDKDTTGVILVAKDTRTQDMLSSLFKDRRVEKTYRAVVEGVPERSRSIIQGNIGRDATDRKKMAVLTKGGREAVTGYLVLETLNGFAYLEAYPKTGRTHQIRVHFAHIGHPIVGDSTYGRRGTDLATRPLLHAWNIAFAHPVKKSFISIEAPVPEDVELFLQRVAERGVMAPRRPTRRSR
jgi:23S rRNA pseudouridine1911/1915/1917 synthase